MIGYRPHPSLLGGNGGSTGPAVDQAARDAATAAATVNTRQDRDLEGLGKRIDDLPAPINGDDGASAFELAKAAGFPGDEVAWLASLRGAPGAPGVGIKGDTGSSAYQIAVDNGFVGDETTWLASLKGTPGAPGVGTKGDGGASAYAIALARGFVGDENAWLASLEGAPGAPGVGTKGDAGASAFAVAQAKGFTGSEVDWLASLVGRPGDQGPSAYQVAVANGFVGSEVAWLASLEGTPGAPGVGIKGDDGRSAFAVAKASGFTGSEADWLASLKGEPADPAVLDSLTTRIGRFESLGGIVDETAKMSLPSSIFAFDPVDVTIGQLEDEGMLRLVGEYIGGDYYPDAGNRSASTRYEHQIIAADRSLTIKQIVENTFPGIASLRADGFGTLAKVEVYLTPIAGETVTRELSIGISQFFRIVDLNVSSFVRRGPIAISDSDQVYIESQGARLTDVVRSQNDRIRELKFKIDSAPPPTPYDDAPIRGLVTDEATARRDADLALAGRIDGIPKGDSAYAVAVSEGFAGTKAEWLASLKGEKGLKGDTGNQVVAGAAGGARIRQSATQKLSTTGVWDRLRFDVSDNDSGGFYSASVPHRFTVPAGVTKVRLTAAVRLAASDTLVENHVFTIYKNGAEVAGSGQCKADLGGRTISGATWSTAVLDVVAGDYFDAMYYLESGSFDLAPGSFLAIEIVERSGASVALAYGVNNLRDVDVTTRPPQEGDVLRYVGGVWKSVKPPGPLIGQQHDRPFHGALLSSPKAIPAGTQPAMRLGFQNAAYDTLAFWTAYQPSRLTIPSGVTKVRLTASFNITGGDSGDRINIGFRKNGSRFPGDGQLRRFVSGIEGFLLCSPPISVQAGDYLEIEFEYNGTILNLDQHNTFSIEVLEMMGA